MQYLSEEKQLAPPMKRQTDRLWGKEILSQREREVLAAIAEGKQYKEIAQKLFISIHTVNFHKKNLYKKLNVHSQSEAAILALRNSLV